MKRNFARFFSVMLVAILVFGTTSISLAAPKSYTVFNGVIDENDLSTALMSPMGLCLGNAGMLYVCDSENGSVKVITDFNNASAVKPIFSGLITPSDVEVGSDGTVYACDPESNQVYAFKPNSSAPTVIGTTSGGFANGSGTSAKFNMPSSIAIDDAGNLYVADTLNHCIRKIDKEGSVSVFAGVPEKSGFADGKADTALFFEPSGIDIAINSGNIYVADTANHVIRKIDKEGNVTTVAGKPGTVDAETGYSSGALINGKGADARFNGPKAIEIGIEGTIFIADTYNHCIRTLKNGVVKTIIGNGMPGKLGANDKNILLTRPAGLATDGKTLYISDTSGNMILKTDITAELLNGRLTADEILKAIPLPTDEAPLRIFLNNKQLAFPVLAPTKTVDTVYIPIKSVFEGMGATVTYDAKTRSVTVKKGTYTANFVSGKDYTVVNDKSQMTLEQLLDKIGIIAEWYPEENTLVLVDNPALMKPVRK